MRTVACGGRSRLCLLFLLNCTALLSASYGGQEGERKYTQRYHCGLYCVYGAARYLGVKLDFRDIVRPEYVGSREGSSLEELRQCVEDNGLQATKVQNIGRGFLKKIGRPTILHVKSDYDSREYDHYVLFIGIERGYATVLDGSQVKKVAVSDLLVLMDGIGTVVTADEDVVDAIIWSARGRMIVYTLLTFAVVGMVRVFYLNGYGRRLLAVMQHSLASVVGQAAVLVVCGSAAGFLYHTLTGCGYYGYTKYTEPIVASYRTTFLPKIGQKKVRGLLGEGAFVVDARYQWDFELGHIEGAINMPPIASDESIDKALSGVDADQTIVVYCQSAGCEFAETTALRIQDRDYGDVLVYRGGWADWSAAQAE